MISIVEAMKTEPSMQEHDVWKSGGYMKMEAVVLYVIGLFNMNVGSCESLQEALGYFGSAIELFTSIGDEINLMTARKNLSPFPVFPLFLFFNSSFILSRVFTQVELK